MCVYDQIRFSCGHREWGQLTQSCNQAFDDRVGCHIQTAGEIQTVGHKCKDCRFSGTRDKPLALVDSPSRDKPLALVDSQSRDKPLALVDLPSRAKHEYPSLNEVFRVNSLRLLNSVHEVFRRYDALFEIAGPPSPVQPDSDTSKIHLDLNPDRRFIEPQKYFSELQSIEAAVVGRSALHVFQGITKYYYHRLSLSTLNRNFHIQIKDYRSETPDVTDNLNMLGMPETPLNSRDQLVKDVSDNLNTLEMSPAHMPRVLAAQYLLFHLLECRNLLARVAKNLKTLQEKNVVMTNFCVLISTPTRPDVVELTELNPEQVYQLAFQFENALIGFVCTCCRDDLRFVVTTTIEILEPYLLQFKKLLPQMLSSLTTEERCRPKTAASIWRSISHSLDFAVISHCGAHIEAFDQHYLGNKVPCLEIFSTFFKGLGPGPTFQRRILKCLDGFLKGQQVWVLHTQGPPPEGLASQPLYLRTSIEAFADVWGPVWITSPIDQPRTIKHFNAGLGFIVPWSRSVETEPAPLSDEINCHWTAHRDAIPSTDATFPDTPDQIYLIGGAAPRITTNTDCPSSAESKTYHLRCDGYLKPFGTCESSRYRDSETIQVQVGSHGIGAAYSRQYKRRSKVTWKAQLVEAWKMEPDRRTPEVLESWSGLEVSACSSNARRRRLIRTLSSDTMRHYLANCQFEWTESKCEQAYFQALSSDNPEAFCDLYRSHKEWRKDLGRAVSWCLEKLLNTGVDGSGSLVSFRCGGPREEWKAMLDPVDHTWIAFLTDTPENGTFAVSSETCLEFPFRGSLEFHLRGGLGFHFRDLNCGSLGKRGYSVLETALEVNPKAESPENLRLCPQRDNDRAITASTWAVSRLKKGDLFRVGADGYLKVEQPLAQAQLLMSWKTRSPRKFKESREMLKQRVLKSPPTLHHWESMYRPSLPTESIPIFIMSRKPIDHARQTALVAGMEHNREDAPSLQPEVTSRSHEGMERIREDAPSLQPEETFRSHLGKHLNLPAARSRASQDAERHQRREDLYAVK